MSASETLSVVGMVFQSLLYISNLFLELLDAVNMRPFFFGGVAIVVALKFFVSPFTQAGSSSKEQSKGNNTKDGDN